jgi:hypothetical protein
MYEIYTWGSFVNKIDNELIAYLTNVSIFATGISP